MIWSVWLMVYPLSMSPWLKMFLSLLSLTVPQPWRPIVSSPSMLHFPFWHSNLQLWAACPVVRHWSPQIAVAHFFFLLCLFLTSITLQNAHFVYWESNLALRSRSFIDSKAVTNLSVNSLAKSATHLKCASSFPDKRIIEPFLLLCVLNQSLCTHSPKNFQRKLLHFSFCTVSDLSNMVHSMMNHSLGFYRTLVQATDFPIFLLGPSIFWLVFSICVTVLFSGLELFVPHPIPKLKGHVLLFFLATPFWPAWLV